MARVISIQIGSLLSDFLLGITKPIVDNTGIDPAVGLTTVSGNQTISAPGIFENKLVNGRIIVQTPGDVLIRNCFVRGSTTAPTSSQGLITSTFASNTNVTIERCTIVPQAPHYFWDGIQGHHFTAYRNNIYGITDGIGVMNTSAPESDYAVNILGNYIHDHGYRVTPSNVQQDLHTHNDGVQIHGGSNIRIEGNHFSSFTNPAYSDIVNPYESTGSQITGQSCLCETTIGSISNVSYIRNWYYGGGEANIHFNIKTTRTISDANCYSNRFGRDQRKGYTIRRRASQIELDAPVSGDLMNFYENDGSPITVVIN